MCYLALLFVFSTVVTKGFSLTCVHCLNNTGVHCSGAAQNCSSPNDACMSLLTQTTTSTGEKTATFERSCAEAAHCDKPGRMSSFSISTGTNSTCCATDSCAPATPTLPAEEALENGVLCRACSTHNVSLCPNNTVIKCKGTETFCAEYVVKSDAESAIIWGCSSESFCHSANRSQNMVNGKGTTVSARCVRSGSRLQRSPSLPLLAALLLGTRGL